MSIATSLLKKREERAAVPATVMTPFEWMDRWMSEVFGGRMAPFGVGREPLFDIQPAFGGRLPKVDLLDREKEFVLRAELPGVSKDDVDVTLADRQLTLKACTHHEERKEEEGCYYRHEMGTTDYERILTLPEDVNAEGVAAKFENGILELTLPKAAPAKRRTIKVQ